MYTNPIVHFLTIKEMNSMDVVTHREASIRLLEDNYLCKLRTFVDFDMYEDADAIYSEYVVDGKDPSDKYEWLFLNDLTQLEEELDD